MAMEHTLGATLLLLLTFCCNNIDVAGAASGEGRSGKVSPFADLSLDEMMGVHHYVHQQKDLNVANINHAKLYDAYIFLIEAIRPNKTDALNYLDHSGPAPQRAARVIIHRGDLPKPIIEEYKVYPIPNPTKHELLINPKWKYPIPFTSRSPFTVPQLKMLEVFSAGELAKVNDILFEISGATYYSNCTHRTHRCLTLLNGLPPYAQSHHYKIIFYIAKYFQGSYLHPIGVQFVINMEPREESKWSVEYVWVQGRAFRNFDHLLEEKRMNRVKVRNIPDPSGLKDGTLSSSLNFRHTPRPEKVQRGPQTEMPDGVRFTVNNRRISWLDWDFEFAMLSSSGIEIFDVRYKKDRIAYELSLQEVGVLYSGKSPVPQYTIFYDTYTNIGAQTSEMFIGIDCPKHAKFFNMVHYLNGKPHLFKNGACVFELDTGIPLRRHYAGDGVGGYSYAQGMPGNVLVFRQVLTVYNYDYIVDFMFHQGGQIEGKVSLSGYVLSSYYTGPEMDAYGYVMNVATSMANIHQHVIHLKADLDIKGRKNRFHTLDTSVEEGADPLNPGFKMYNHVFKKNLATNEKQAASQVKSDKVKYLVVSNEESKNKFGHPRGYRILSKDMTKMLLPRNYRGNRSRAFTYYPVAVTKYNDFEKQSSSMYNTMEPYDPPMSFQDFIDDDDNIVDEDLVVWLTLGTHHIPHTEDVPIVTTPGVQLHYYLLPFNYYDEDPAMTSCDNTRVTPNGKGGNKHHYACYKEEDFVHNKKDIKDKSKSSGVKSGLMCPPYYVLFISILTILWMKRS